MIQTRYLSSIITKAFNKGLRSVELYGFKSPSPLGLGIMDFATNYPNKKHLIVVPTNKDIDDLELSLKLAGVEIAKKWYEEDSSPYTSILSSQRALAQRLGFLSAAALSETQIFICHAKNLSLRVSPEQFFQENSLSVKTQQDLGDHFVSTLKKLGYRDVHTVEDPLSFSVRGELIDIFPPNYDQPIRIEFFDTLVESMRHFDPDNQRSTSQTDAISIAPALELLYDGVDLESLIANWKKSCKAKNISWLDKKPFVSKLTKRQYFDGLSFLFPYLYPESKNIFSYFDDECLWLYDAHEIQKSWESHFSSRKQQFLTADSLELCPFYEDLYTDSFPFETLNCRSVFLTPLRIEDDFGIPDSSSFEFPMRFSQTSLSSLIDRTKVASLGIAESIRSLRQQGFVVLCSFHSPTQLERAKLITTSGGLKYHQVKEISDLNESLERQKTQQDLVSFVVADFPEGLILDADSLAIFTEQDFFGKKERKTRTKTSGSLDSRTNQLKFSDLKVGDQLVHIQHGVGKYLGMETMELQGAQTEFVRLEYRGGDKLFIPAYKVGLLQKYSGTHSLDRLGSKSWENAKIKVKAALKDIADELIRLYAKRSALKRPSYGLPPESYQSFEDQFPYVETDDQLIAIKDIQSDLLCDSPMDRLVCGDVGFGKTEVAMRAAFLALGNNKQVAILVPTTVLAFQHYENFKKRFKDWPFEIRSLGRFNSKKESKDSLEMLRMGTLDILIGTHRLLSADVNFANIGLIIIDEEHRFGVSHKEKLKQLKTNIDSLSLSATPIPRSLNMALMGIRDLSIINTAPRDRLPIRTFINRFNRASIRKAILAEVERGGQIYFVHNRVQSIYARAAEIREIVPEASLEIAHGQMKDGELEKSMLRFFENKFNILICTTIVENGVDNPRANTMIIDSAQNFGLSQLYQLRGRVGRSSDRAYCYLVIPQNMKLDSIAKERLRVIQENSALGSGFKIANHDLELRGAGNFLGAEQSGHANAVGYDLYVDLLEQTLKEAKGEELEEQIEPDINLKVAALIPDRYIPDIRIRLSYYKQLAEIQSEEQLEQIEADLSDQFGKLPDELINLMGIMLIRKHCRDLGIKEISAGKVNLSLAFTESTSVAVSKLVKLAMNKPSLYRLTPESKLVVRMEDITWPHVLDLMKFLAKL